MSDQELVQNTDLRKQTEMKDVLELAPRGQWNLSTTYTIQLTDFNESKQIDLHIVGMKNSWLVHRSDY